MKNILLLLSITFFSLSSQAAIFTAATGNWNAPATWTLASGTDADGIPDANDIVYILLTGGNITVTVPNGYIAECLDLNFGTGSGSASCVVGVGEFGGGGTLNILGNLTYSAGNAAGDARIRFDGVLGASTVNITGNISFTSSSTVEIIDFANTGTLNLTGTLGLNGKITGTSSGTFNFKGSTAQTIQLGATYQYGNITSNNTSIGGAFLSEAITATNVQGNLTVASGILDNGGFVITGNSTTFQVDNGATFKLTGTSAFPTGFGTTTLASGSTVEYGGTTQTVADISPTKYDNLVLSGSGTKTLGGAGSDITGNLTVSAGILTNGGLSLSCSGASKVFTIADGATYQMTGTTGTPTGFTTVTLSTGSTVDYAGGVQSVTATNYHHLKISAAGTKTLAAGTTNLSGDLTVSLGDFNMNGQAFIIKSGATSTGSIQAITGNLLNATNVTVERYISATGAGWRILSPPGAGETLQYIKNNASTTGFANSNNPPPGYTWVSTYFYTEANNAGSSANGYTAPSDISDAVAHIAGGGSGTGANTAVIQYFDVSGTTPVPLTLSPSVAITAGTRTYSNMSLTGAAGTETGWHMIGNPYPAPLDWNAVITNGMTNIGNSGAIYTSNASGNFGATAGVIASGEGGFVQVTSATNTITIQENDKIVNADTYNDKLAYSALPELVFQISVNGHTDKAKVIFNNNATANFEHSYDATKMDNIYGRTNIWVETLDGVKAEWNSLPDSVDATIPLVVNRNYFTTIDESYTLSITGVDNLIANNSCLIFEDTVAGVSFPLTTDTSYTFMMNDTFNVARLFIKTSTPIQDITTTDATCSYTANGSVSVANGGNSTATYTWTNVGNGTVLAQTSNTLTGLLPGIYNVELNGITGNCASATTNIFVASPNPITIFYSATNNNCNGGSNGSITPNILGGGSSTYTYNWSNGISLAEATNLVADTYTLTVSDINGCTNTQSVVITQPEVLLLNQTIAAASCFGFNDGSVNTVINASPMPTSTYSYAWSNGGNAAISSSLVAGNYTLTATDANNCATIFNYVVTEPTNISIAPAITEIACNNGSNGEITVTTTGGAASPYIYQWSNGSFGFPTIFDLAEGTYTVTATDADGCVGTESFTLVSPAAVMLDATAYDVSCFGLADGEVAVSMLSGAMNSNLYTYSWSDNSTSLSNSGMEAGTYILTTKDANNCETMFSYTLTEPAEIVAAFTTGSDTVLINNGGTATFTNASTGASSYSWDFGDGNTSTDASPTNTYTTEGNFTVTLTATEGNCSSTVTKQVAVLNITGIAIYDANDNIIFIQSGNILTGTFISPINDVVTVVVFNSIGQQLNYNTISTNSNSFDVELPQANGTYIIKIMAGDKQFIKKYIVAN